MLSDINEMKPGETLKINSTLNEVMKIINDSNGEFGIIYSDSNSCTIKRVSASSDADRVRNLCENMRYFEEKEITAVQPNYLRILVSRYNAKESANVLVRKKGDEMYLYKDVALNADVYEKGQMVKDLRDALGFTHEAKTPTRTVNDDPADGFGRMDEELDEDDELLSPE